MNTIIIISIYLVLFCQAIMMFYLMAEFLELKNELVQKAKVEFRKFTNNMVNKVKANEGI